MVPKCYFYFYVMHPETLIKKAFGNKHPPQLWADLGCGKGAFTYALAKLLSRGSKIFAVDSATQNIKSNYGNASIEFIRADFNIDKLSLKNLDGILMANSLHFIEDKIQCIQQLKNYCTSAGKIIIVEYNRKHSNLRVPYPIDYDGLMEISEKLGFHKIERIGEQNSQFGGSMYAALIFF